MLDWNDISYAYEDEHDILDDYNDYFISNANWNDKNIKLLHIAFYIILNNPQSKNNIEPNRLKAIRKKVSKVKLRVAKQKIKSFNSEWYTDNISYDEAPNTLNIQQRLGKYAKHFERTFSNMDCVDNTLIKDTKKKYLRQNGVHALNCANGVIDEVTVINDFLRGMELIKEELIDVVTQANKTSKYGYNYKPGADMKLTDLYDKLKEMLTYRLKAIGVSDSKINRLTPRAITAIKKEILNS